MARTVSSAQPRWRGLLPRWCCPRRLELQWGLLRPWCWSWPGQPSLLSSHPALPPKPNFQSPCLTGVWGCDHSGRPGCPASCLGEAGMDLRSCTLRAVCSLFAEVLWPVFWFSYVLESHKLKTGHFPDLIQVTCPFFFRVCPRGGSVLSGHSVCGAGCGCPALPSSWPLPGRSTLWSSEEGEGCVLKLPGSSSSYSR